MINQYSLEILSIHIRESEKALAKEIEVARKEPIEYLQGYLDSDKQRDNLFRRVYRLFEEPIGVVARRRALEERTKSN